MSSEDIDSGFTKQLKEEGFIQIREGPDVDILLKALEPMINEGEVIGASVNYRAQDWHVFIKKDFYDEHKTNPESLEGVVKKAIEQLFVDEQRNTLNVHQGSDAVVLEQFADSESRKIVRWNDGGDCTVEHYAEGRNGTYLAFTEHIFPLNKNELQLYKKDIEFYLLDKTRGLFLPAREYFDAVGVAKKQQDIAFAALSLLPVEQGEPYGLELVEINDHLGLPPLELIYTSNWYAQKLKAALTLSSDKELLEQLSEELWQISSPKQRADRAAIIGAAIFNVVNRIRKMGLREVLIHLGGATLSGKTWIVERSLKLDFGIDLLQPDVLLNSDTFSSPFRFESVISSTNLPILIDDADAISKQLMSLVKSKTGGGFGARGHADQTVSTYSMKATIVSTGQYNIYAGVAALSDDMAVSNRLYVNNYEQGDADPKQKVAHDAFISKLNGGGLVYLWLQEHTVDELQRIVLEAYEAADGDSTIAAMLIGLGFLGKLTSEAVGQIAVEAQGGADPRDDAVAAIRADFEQLQVGRWPDPKMATSLDRDDKWLYISSMYLQYVNRDPRHPLNGRFRNLGSLKELAPALGVKPDDVYDRAARHKFGGVAACFAKIPADVADKEGYTSVTESVTKIAEIIREKENTVTQIHKLHLNHLIRDKPATYIQNECNKCNSVTTDDKGGYTTQKQCVTSSENQTDPNTFSNISAENSTSDQEKAAKAPNPANSPFQENGTSQPDTPSTSVSPAEGQAAGFASLPAPGENDPTGSMDSPAEGQGAARSSPQPTAPDPTDRLATIKQVLTAVKEAENLNIVINPDDPDPRLYGTLSGLYPDQIKAALLELEHSGDIYSPRPGYWKVAHADDVDV